MKASNLGRLAARRRQNEVSGLQTKQSQSQVGDYTSTILDILNDRRPSLDTSSGSAVASQSAPESVTSSAVAPPPPAKPAVALEAVAHAVGKLKGVESTPVTDLQAMLGMGFPEFGGLVTNLYQLGLVTISGEPGAETIALTPQGELLSQMA